MSKNKNKTEGICCICGQQKVLTFEHIPPRAVGNNIKVKLYSLEDLIKTDKHSKRLPWETQGIKYKQQQKGMGRYSLCQSCNNNTGAWYGESYIELSLAFAHFLTHEKPKVRTEVKFEIEMKPLNFIKQVLSMFCTLNNEPLNDEVSEFLLNPEKRLEDLGNFKVFMFLNVGVMQKFSGPMAMAILNGEESIKIFAEIDSYPMGFTLFYNGHENYKRDGVDITSFCSSEYNKEYKVIFPIPILESNNIFPQDFRSKKQLEVDITKSREYMNRVPEVNDKK